MSAIVAGLQQFVRCAVVSCLLFCSFHIAVEAADVNSIPIPIIQSEKFVHTRFVAQFPRDLGGQALINCITHHGKYLYVVTLLRVFRLLPDGSDIQLFLDLDKTIAKQTDRKLTIENRSHGGVRCIAFHPTRPLFYVSAMETRPSNPSEFRYISDVAKHANADSVLLEFQTDSAGRAQPETYRCVFRVGIPIFDHPIKQIAFYGKYLYISHGDGSEQDISSGDGQNPDARGKILRIDPVGNAKKPYKVPKSNPFVGDSSMPDEVWALGFRSAHHICFGSDGTLYAAETGRSNVEEVNLVKPGHNYGWAKREGTFVHTGGRLLTGIAKLPADDAKFGFTYPNAQVGHVGPVGSGFIGQAIAGGCPVENKSPMSGSYYYCDFPISGKLFFSSIRDLKNAVTMGDPNSLRQARTMQLSKICFDHDGNPNTPPKKFSTLMGIILDDPQFADEDRADIRLGRGPSGELYWSSKSSGRLYVFTSSLDGGPDYAC